MNEKISIKSSKNAIVLPCVAMRDIMLFPNMVMHFDVARERSVKALKKSIAGDGKIFLTAQRDVNVSEPEFKDVYNIGVIADIKQIVKGAEGVSRVLVEGLYKAKLVRLDECEEGFLEAEVKKLPNYSKEKFEEAEVEALCREIKHAFEEYASVVPRMPNELYAAVLGCSSPKTIFETAANEYLNSINNPIYYERNSSSRW